MTRLVKIQSNVHVHKQAYPETDGTFGSTKVPKFSLDPMTRILQYCQYTKYVLPQLQSGA